MSLILKTSSVFTAAGLPRLYRDSILNAGSLCLFDFANTYCFPKQAAPVSGDTFVNLVDGAPGGVVANYSNAFGFAGGGIFIPGYGGATSSYIDLGDNYNLSALGSPDFLQIAWVKQDAASYDTVSNQGIWGRSNDISTANCQFHLEMNSQLSGRVSNGTTNVNPVAGSGFAAPIAKTQIAQAWVNGVLYIYANGVLVSSAGIAGPLNNPAGARAKIGAIQNFWKGYVYRTYLENLTVSGKSAATQVLADYNANVSRFS